MLPTKESLTVEFKSERQRPQTDDEIVDNVVAMANTEGGTLYLGVEDDGMVTGVCDRHRNVNGLAAFIFKQNGSSAFRAGDVAERERQAGRRH